MLKHTLPQWKNVFIILVIVLLVWLIAAVPALGVNAQTTAPKPIPPSGIIGEQATLTRVVSSSAQTEFKRSPPPVAQSEITVPVQVAGISNDCPELITNGDFETGSFTPWEVTGVPVVLGAGRNSTYAAWLGGTQGSPTNNTELKQSLTIPSDYAEVTLNLWWYADNDVHSPIDFFQIIIQTTSYSETLAYYHDDAAFNAWKSETFDLSAYRGEDIELIFYTGHAHADDPTTFRVDDVSIQACDYSPGTTTGCQDLLNGGDFETGDFAHWPNMGDITMGTGYNSTYGPSLGGMNNASGELFQILNLPSEASSAQLAFWWKAENTASQPNDTLEVVLETEAISQVLSTLTGASAARGVWEEVTLDLSDYLGEQIGLFFRASTDASVPSTFRIDDVSLIACRVGLSNRIFEPTGDTYLVWDQPGTNFGDQATLMTEDWTLIQFDLSDMLTQTEVISAHLGLVLTGTQGTAASKVYVYKVTEAWDELAVTYNSVPNADLITLSGVDVPTTTGKIVYWEITSLAQGWITNPSTNYGLMLRVPDKREANAETDRTYASRESQSPPSLSLVFSVPEIEWPEPAPTPLPPHETTTIPISQTAYLYYEGQESLNQVQNDPGIIIASADPVAFTQGRSLLQFDLRGIPTDTLIYQATLELYQGESENPEQIPLEAHQLTLPWTPETATWTLVRMSPVGPGTFGGETLVGTDNIPGWVSIDITPLVQGWVLAPHYNYGMQLKGPDGTREPWVRSFDSSGTNAPHLVVHYATGGVVNLAAHAPANPNLPDPLDVDLCPLDGIQHRKIDDRDVETMGERRQWGTIEGHERATLSGVVVDTHLDVNNYPPTHDKHDFVFSLDKDYSNAWAFGNRNGEVIEVKWEEKPFPEWAWPAEGDEAIVYGQLVYDCSLMAVKKGTVTQIHPPLGVVTKRTLGADLTPHGGWDTRMIQRADLFFSNRRTRAHCGGFCDMNDPLYPPLNAADFEFDLYPQGEPQPGAKLVWWTEDPAAGSKDQVVPDLRHDGAQQVKPQITVVGTGANQHLHVKLPFKTDHGSYQGLLYTAQSIYYGWASTTTTPELRAFKVQVHSVYIDENADDVDAEWYPWLRINEHWFYMRDYAPRLGDATETSWMVPMPYHNAKDLVAHVVIPADEDIHIQMIGYEADCRDDFYGKESPEPSIDGWDVASALSNLATENWVGFLFDIAELFWKGISDIYDSACYDDETDTIQTFDMVFNHANGFGLGPTQLYPATGPGSGRYRLEISIVEDPAPFQLESINVPIGDVNLNGTCASEEYGDSAITTLRLTNGVQAEVYAAYDEDYLYGCIKDFPTAGIGPGDEAALYLDPGYPSGGSPAGLLSGYRTDDLRIGVALQGSDLNAMRYNPIEGDFSIPVDLQYISAAKSSGSGVVSVEFRVSKLLISRGPWWRAEWDPLENPYQQGIGMYFAAEDGDGSRMWGWPVQGASNAPNAWARAQYAFACPMTFEVMRTGELLGDEKLGSTLINIQYTVHDIPGCNLRDGELTFDLPSEFFKPIPHDYIDEETPMLPEDGIYDNDKITWYLPTSDKEWSVTFGIQQKKPCSDFTDTQHYIISGQLDGTLTTKYENQSVPEYSLSQAAFVCPIKQKEAYDDPRIPDWESLIDVGQITEELSPDQVVPVFDSFFDITEPLAQGDPVEVVMNITNNDSQAHRVIVRARGVSAGVSGFDPATNPELNFANTPYSEIHEIPAETTIVVKLEVDPNMPVCPPCPRIASANNNGVAVEVELLDTWLPEQVSSSQVVPYVDLTTGADNILNVTVIHPEGVPGELHLQPLVDCPGWGVSLNQEVLEPQPAGIADIVQVHLEPPAGATLGSGCPVSLVSWNEAGEVIGVQRVLDNPPVGVSIGQHPFASGELFAVPLPIPKPGQEAQVCAVVRNWSDSAAQADIQFGMSDRLSTAPLITDYETIPVDLSAGEIAEICGSTFTWTNDRSFVGIIGQDEFVYNDIHSHVGSVPLPIPLSTQAALATLEVRNPLATAETVLISYTLVGLPGWSLDLPESVDLDGGEATVITIAPTGATNLYPGDEGYIDIWTYTAEGEYLGGARFLVWQPEIEAYLFLPVIFR